MSRVITNIGIIRCISNSKYKATSIDLITQFDEPREIYISNSKYKAIAIELITLFDEPRDYEYWNYKIYF